MTSDQVDELLIELRAASERSRHGEDFWSANLMLRAIAAIEQFRNFKY